jgi:hypothetical protein
MSKENRERWFPSLHHSLHSGAGGRKTIEIVRLLGDRRALAALTVDQTAAEASDAKVKVIISDAFGRPVPGATVTLTILINIIYDQANGHEIAPERMRELIVKADAGKVEKALERLKENIRER